MRAVSPENRLTSAWRGAQIVANLSSHASEWITLEQYDECGTDILSCRFLQCLDIDLPDYIRQETSLQNETLTFNAQEESSLFQ